MSQGARFLNPDKLLPRMGPRAFRRAMRLFPPIRNTGVRVDHISDDWRHWRLRLPMGIKTRNYVGTHFGGTLYSAADPHMMLAWMHILGEGFIVWDKAASIRFRRPGRGTLRAEFELPQEHAEEARALQPGAKLDKTYRFDWVDGDGHVIAEVEKVVHIQRRPNA